MSGQGSRVAAVLAALALVLANAPKPLIVDDTAYALYAEQIRRDPTDPYGFEIFWYGAPEPALEVLAPPLLPYWLAGARALFGDDPVPWKLSLLPFALALAFALRSLFARFAPGLEVPLLWMAIASPSVLPFLNLMLDIPALSLALGAVALFLSACDRGRAAGAALAGLVAGLAMQTKYIAATAPLAMLAYGALARRPRLAGLACAMAAAVFLGVEVTLALRYGDSHFVLGVERVGASFAGPSPAAALGWIAGFATLLGAMAPGVGLLALFALGGSRRAVAAAALPCALAFVAIPFLPAAAVPEIRPSDLLPRLGDPPVEQVLLGALGLAVVASVAILVVRRLRREPTREDLFLAAWLGIEVAGFAALSPFLAARRVLGVSLIALICCGREAARRVAQGAARDGLRVALGFGVGLALLFAASDFAGACAQRDSVRLAEAALRDLGADPARETVWFSGHWGFRFYAERAGMRPFDPTRSRPRAGDWIVVPEGIFRQAMTAVRASRALARLAPRSASPWSTLPWAYAGPTAIRARTPWQVRVSIHRVVDDGARLR
jgi:hypothetical protein